MLSFVAGDWELKWRWRRISIAKSSRDLGGREWSTARQSSKISSTASLFARGQILLAGRFVLDRRSPASMAPPRGSAGFFRTNISLTLGVSALFGMSSRRMISRLTRGHPYRST